MNIKYNNVPESDPLDNEQDYYDNHPDNPKNKMSKQTELVIYDQNKFVEIFTEKTGDSFIEKLEKEVADFQKTSDISSEEGRKAIRSYSYELSQHKAPLKKAKLEITEKVRNTITALNSEENRIQDRIQELQDEVRKPLTEFEEKEKKRVVGFQDRIKDMESYNNTAENIDLETINHFIYGLNDIYKGGEGWQEFKWKAKTIFDNVSSHLHCVKGKIEKREAEQAELDKLRKEKEEREKKEREEQIAREAAENAKRIAREEAERLAREVEEEKYRLEAEKKAAEQAKINAENRIVEAAKKAKEEKEQAEIQAKKDKEEAIRLERARAEAERQKQIDEEKTRGEDLKHKTKIYQEIINALFPYIDNNKQAIIKTKNIIAGIAKGKIPYISIKF